MKESERRYSHLTSKHELAHIHLGYHRRERDSQCCCRDPRTCHPHPTTGPVLVESEKPVLFSVNCIVQCFSYASCCFMGSSTQSKRGLLQGDTRSQGGQDDRLSNSTGFGTGKSHTSRGEACRNMADSLVVEIVGI